jgi:serine/threonine-protein kinase
VLTGKRVAIEWLRGDQGRRRDGALRTIREARAWGRIHHPNVADIYDAGFAEEHPFIVMKLLEGESLEQPLGRDALAVAEAVRCIRRIRVAIARY